MFDDVISIYKSRKQEKETFIAENKELEGTAAWELAILDIALDACTIAFAEAFKGIEDLLNATRNQST